jgi:DNA (cytosine-5)-methyltransferase 1
MQILAGLDIDLDSGATFQANFPAADFLLGDIRSTDTDALAPIMMKVPPSMPVLFSGCAPCQPFSKQNANKRHDDPRRNLLSEFLRFIKAWQPHYVFVENVPGLQKPAKLGPLAQFVRSLRNCGYSVTYSVVPALWFGVPQKRERLILLAYREGKASLPEPTHGPGRIPATTVRDWIGGLRTIMAGESDPNDPDHQAARLSLTNLERIKYTAEGSGREAWPLSLQLACHRHHAGHSDVYGRLAWDKPAAGLTTRCISYSNGRFGHPEQNRAISLREAACLQTFPPEYVFRGSLRSKARQVGNAVPPLLAEVFGRHILKEAEAT